MISVMTDIVWRITEHWYAGAAMCKIVRYLQVSVAFRHTCSSALLHPDYLIVSVERDQLAVAYPRFSVPSDRSDEMRPRNLQIFFRGGGEALEARK